MPRIEPASLVAPLQEGPVVLDVGVGHGVVGVGPVHPLTQLLRLLRLDLGKVQHPFAAGAGETLQAIRLDLPLRVEAQGLLDFDFHPESLAVEPVLEALIVTT
jgi:hypothetical protein